MGVYLNKHDHLFICMGGCPTLHYMVNFSGKSTTMRNALSLLGAEEGRVFGPDCHPLVIVNAASTTTIPLEIDDLQSAKRAEHITVQFFNGFAHKTTSCGERNLSHL
jgi:hypothetical protein